MLEKSLPYFMCLEEKLNIGKQISININILNDQILVSKRIPTSLHRLMIKHHLKLKVQQSKLFKTNH